jgi:DNA-binding CsgD family transcriptional regulator
MSAIKTEAACLTSLERFCLHRLARGDDEHSIAKEAGRTEMIVGICLQRAVYKLGAKNRMHAVVLAIEKGIITLK